jgi:signal transduction histidine kinase
MEAKQQTLRLELLEPSLNLPADRNQMIQVFVNLVVNAINYTPSGGWIALRAETSERSAGRWAIVSVSDNGIGIPVEDQKRVFDRFYRGQAEHFGVSGTGLGLAIVHEIVRQHAGEIRVDSQVGQGATFTVSLPMNERPG